MTQWQKSTFSSGTDGSNCVELAAKDGKLLLRESDDPDRILPLSRTGVTALLRHLDADPC
ncbi:DUF397 domain-containing protein [Streptomyces sp. NBC_00554]|uniref:DUF397 domain-containing protein n=1 Tax=unclassified Streptomyces TaxID=2593676 RepID=UPI002251B4E4|nr:DUF397 domain-containing protein [Streptomyces sp. NBC_00620]MCX4972928.1 DUF397 domain-containing protein [Streptomyces sp. NBC_00620]WUC50869.1 DUF397 domain-containing protein [Streptomyces sp. NBC_00554]